MRKTHWVATVLSLALPLALAAPASAHCGCEHKVKVKTVKCKPVRTTCWRPLSCGCTRTVAYKPPPCGCARTVAYHRPSCGCGGAVAYGSTDNSFVTTTGTFFRPVVRVISYPFRSHESNVQTVSYEQPVYETRYSD